MKKFINILFLLIVLISSTPCCAQRVEYDFYKDGLRYITTASTAVLTPSNSHFPISISLDYYGNENVRQYYLRLYGRYELTKDTKLALVHDDGTEMQFEPYASNIYHNRLGLIKMKSIYDALYIISNEQLDHILYTTIVGVKIKTGDGWHSKTFKHNKIGEWLNLNYREISKRTTDQIQKRTIKNTQSNP